MSHKLLVFNPSPYFRKGYVAIPWQEVYNRTLINEDELALYQDYNVSLPFQIDDLDPSDPSRKVLIFALSKEAPPAPNDNFPSSVPVFIDKHRSKILEDTEINLDVISDANQVRGLKFINSRLELYFNLTPNLNEQRQTWYAGSATSVLLDNKEIISAFYEGMFHNDEKRCMQLDFIDTFRPPWEGQLQQKESFIDKPYHLVSKSVGPIRASVTIASQPFDYSYLDPLTGQVCAMHGKLYRIISLYAGANYLTENLFVKGLPYRDRGQKSHIYLHFIPHYFSYLDYFQLEISSFESAPNWFAAYNSVRPFRGYGFATDRHIDSILNPHPDYPEVGTEFNSFSWKLLPSREANCLHLFMDFRPVENVEHGESFLESEHRKQIEAKHYFESQVGHAWYELIHKPLWAEIVD
jgi:hypothetical protein